MRDEDYGDRPRKTGKKGKALRDDDCGDGSRKVGKHTIVDTVAGPAITTVNNKGLLVRPCDGLVQRGLVSGAWSVGGEQ